MARFCVAASMSLEQALCQDELLAVDVVRQSRPLVPALIAVHLRPAKGRAFAACATKPQIEVQPVITI